MQHQSQCNAVWKTWRVSPINSAVCVEFCMTIVTAIVLDLRSLIKTASRTPVLLLRVESLCQGFTCKWTSEWMNTNLCSFALCQLVPSWFFLSKCSLLRNFSLSTTLHAWALKFQSTWMVPSNDPFLWKQTSEKFIKQKNRNLTFRISSWNLFEYLCDSMQRRLSGARPFFLRRSSLWSSICFSSTVEISFIFLDLCRFSRVDVAPSGLENVPKPRRNPPETGSPLLSAVSSTCKAK